MGKNISKNQIWGEILHGLETRGIDYVLVGAAALVVHGVPRSTVDVDIYVPARADMLVKIFELAEALGLKSDQAPLLKLQDSPGLFVNQWVCFGRTGRDVLDVFFAPEEEYERLCRKSMLRKEGDLAVRLASLDDIVAMKKESGRPQDLADIVLAQEVKNACIGQKKKKRGGE